MSKDNSTSKNKDNSSACSSKRKFHGPYYCDPSNCARQQIPSRTPEGMESSSEEPEPKNRRRGGEWIIAKILPPHSAIIEMGDGDLVLRWEYYLNFPHPVFFKVKIYETNVLFREDITHDQEYRIPRENYNPMKYYFGEVSAQTSYRPDLESEIDKSTRKMLCSKLGDGNVYLDESSRLSEDHPVYLGYMKGFLTDKVAVKLVAVNEDSLEKVRFEREIQSLIKLGSWENVVTYRDSGKVQGIGNRYFIAMELCCKDNLSDMLTKGLLKGKPDQKKKVLLHIMRGLSRIHERGILHRDLKPQNVLRSLDKQSMKICDFGLSKYLTDDKSKVSKSALEVGTDGWGSPEHYADGTHMWMKSDTFSAGLVFCFVLSDGIHACGDRPYKWKSNIIEKVKFKLPDFECDDPALAADLVEAMLEFDPEKRPHCKQVLAHPFFWPNGKKLNFIQYVSRYVQGGRFDQHNIFQDIVNDLSRIAKGFTDWHRKIVDPICLDGGYLYKLATGKFRFKYSQSFLELIRFIRNIGEHHNEHPESSQLFNDDRANVWIHFSKIFPNLLPGLYRIFYKRLSDMEQVAELSDIRELLKEEPPYSPLELSD